MLTTDKLHHYQLRAINHVIENPASMLWVGMGLGKTIVVLSAFGHLMQHHYMRAALVVGPRRVVESVWSQEALKWEHTRGLRFSHVLGTADERTRALTKPADFYLINYENLPWLAEALHHYYIDRGIAIPFDGLALDESTKMKNGASKRMQALAPLLPRFNWRVGLTGTPAANGLQDLWGQFLCVDLGARLGRVYDHYIAKYFEQGDYGGYKSTPTPEGERTIHALVSDITLQLRSEDYVKLPDMIVNDIYVDIPEKKRAQYDQLEIALFTELDDGQELEVKTEAAKLNKLLQFANGAAYTDTESKSWSPVHDAKLDALEDVMEESGGEPVLVAYNYRPDAARILKRFPYAKDLTGMSASEFNAALTDWKMGNLRMLIGHPASMGHGVDGLQDRGHIIVWFGLNWSLELTDQLNARLHRQGQGEPVIVHRILARDTADEIVKSALSYKYQTQESLRDAVDQYRKRKSL